jgi:hypothetical protein
LKAARPEMFARRLGSILAKLHANFFLFGHADYFPGLLPLRRIKKVAMRTYENAWRFVHSCPCHPREIQQPPRRYPRYLIVFKRGFDTIRVKCPDYRHSLMRIGGVSFADETRRSWLIPWAD